ncbi:MAG: DUF5343 domain-containing protein [Candidatus Thiodiazotropha sp. (ex Lucina aurantia)]|nr:DUF5343 domain-containing protein [Candidatus Thiodiazotropha sp. (ex Lucina pensylvanica)]MBT3017859.1 DUF5343 domain-containing protein [Candidatus Thiodiazotropha taylori]MBT3041004.1 DUF5343 domain-containing protein [Candidatus Thiodiazotropha sp. (ex Codakia orbicularis)]MBV2104414.1 DUF5343 domain-containing protein [Candidatus Thiodiazotropha sp. (ex Lucina aurantia)]MBV2099521.1 DUF5343 domain-containing protein [Candidatus Thiodiazotropha sp. (ex Codakia orbicularis)]
MANLPYVTSVGTLINMLEKVKKASVPPSFSQEFVEKTLLMKGGTARATMPFLKKMGLVADDGTPTERYRQFRNENRSGAAIAASMRELFSPLFDNDEKIYERSDKDVKEVIVEITGSEKTAQVTKMTLATFKALNAIAEFSDIDELKSAEIAEDVTAGPSSETIQPITVQKTVTNESGEAINLSYTINLNLPPTSDIKVFHAIFGALKEHLLK